MNTAGTFSYARKLRRPLPEVAGDIRLQIAVRRAASRVPGRAGEGSGVGVRAARARGLSVGRAVVGHVIIGRAGTAADLVRAA